MITRKIKKMQNLKKSGFTLIELLVVIVILGILASIGFSSFKGYFGKAFNAERQSNVKTIATIVKADQAANFSDTKYVYNATSLKQLFDENDFYPKTKENFCYFYGHKAGTPNSSSDNEFIVVTNLGDIASGGEYGIVDGAGAGVGTVRGKLTNATDFKDKLLCGSGTATGTIVNSTVSSMDTITGTSGFTWLEIK